MRLHLSADVRKAIANEIKGYRLAFRGSTGYATRQKNAFVRSFAMRRMVRRAGYLYISSRIPA